MKKLMILVMGCGLLSACENKMGSIPDDELADIMHECRSVNEQSPGMAIKCDNIARECSNRREDGNYVC